MLTVVVDNCGLDEVRDLLEKYTRHSEHLIILPQYSELHSKFALGRVCQCSMARGDRCGLLQE